MTMNEKLALLLEELYPTEVRRNNSQTQALRLTEELRKRGLYFNQARNDPSGRW